MILGMPALAVKVKKYLCKRVGDLQELGKVSKLILL